MTMTDCASCADERAAGAAFCEACGNALSPATPEPTPTPAAVVAVSTCPHCGAAGAVGADGYCEQCGMLAGRTRDHLEIDAGAAAASVTDRGLRHHRNEDAMWLTVRDGTVLVVISDGVSASYDPDVASETAVEAAGASLTGEGGLDGGMGIYSPEEWIDAVAGRVSTAISRAGEAVAELARNGDPRRAASNPACTIVAAAVNDAFVTYGWVGDSRAYWLPATGPIAQLTEDDSWATHVISLGVDPEVAMRDPKAHAITAWLGADAGPVTPRTGGFAVTEPGHLIVCSDGLWNYLTDPVAFASTARVCLLDTTLIDAARALTDFAVASGGADNITVALIPVNPIKE
ncbi:PP2C family protein-serine/threonine phosphatase [Micromonosporaceae bacterium Da 78-11]